MKFDEDVTGSKSDDQSKGLPQLSDSVLTALVAAARKDGFDSQFSIVAYLTKVYGGDLVQNAMRVYELEKMDGELENLRQRVDDIDLIHTPEEPGKAPAAYNPNPSELDKRPRAYNFDDPLPVIEANPCDPNLQPRVIPQVSVPNNAQVAPRPQVVVPGRHVPNTVPTIPTQFSQPTSLANDPLFNRPPVDTLRSGIPTVLGSALPPAGPPIPGVTCPSTGQNLGDPFMRSLAYNIDRMANPDVSAKPGTIEGIRRMGEIHVYVARFFDNHLVDLGPGITGKALAQHLKSLNERIRPLYEAYKIPTGFTNRLCIGASCLTRGGRDKEEDCVLCESDFVAWTPNDFDKYTAPATWSLGPKPKSSHHVETWRTNAINMARMFCALYGAEYLSERIECIEHLRQMHLSCPHKYPLGFVKNAWGTLNVRWVRDLKAMADTLRLHARVERPTFQQLQAVGMTIVEATGSTLYRRPDTFNVHDPWGYFVSEILRKLNDDKELKDWAHYHSANRTHPSRVSGPALDASPSDLSTLPGPTLTPSERRLAGAKGPTNAAGIKLCWNFNTHVGCSDSQCPRAHEYVENYEALIPQVKISFAKRYGFKKKGKLTEPKINDTIRALRAEVTATLAANRQAPGVRGDSNPNWVPTSRVSGGLGEPPTELTKIDYLLEEDELRRAVNPSPSPFGSVIPQDEDPSLGRIIYEDTPESEDPKFVQTKATLEAMDHDNSLKCLSELPPHLATFLRAHIMHDKFSGNSDTDSSLEKGLELAMSAGLPTLREEAGKFHSSRSRVGDSQGVSDDSDHIYFDCPRKVGKLTMSTMVFRGHTWRVADFGDTIPDELGDPIGDFYGASLSERNKCLLIHLAAGGTCSNNDSDETLEDKYSQVVSLGLSLRLEQYYQARECNDELGEPTSNDPLIIAELRSHVHDIMNPHRDRDRKTLLCFPVKLMGERNVCLIRVTPSCLFSIHVTKSLLPSKAWLFLVSSQ